MKYWELQENKRAHAADEAERHRTNVANENIKFGTLRETQRTNRANESIKSGTLDETIRTNQVKEAETERSNKAKETETIRSNKASESEKQRTNDIAYYKAAAEVTNKYADSLYKLSRAADYGYADYGIGVASLAGLRGLVALPTTQSDKRLLEGQQTNAYIKLH